MTADTLLELWNMTSDESLVNLMEIEEWRYSAARTFLARRPPFDILVRAFELVLRDEELCGRFLIQYMDEIVSRPLSPDEIRAICSSHCFWRVSVRVQLDLRRRLLGPQATIEELIGLTRDPDPMWRERAVTEVLRRKDELSYKQWAEGLLRCWGDERHADIAPRIWANFREKCPHVDFWTLSEIAQWCPHVQGLVVDEYLTRTPRQIAPQQRDAHTLYGVAGLVLNSPVYGGALWMRECLAEEVRSRLHRKAESFVHYAQRLERGKR